MSINLWFSKLDLTQAWRSRLQTAHHWYQCLHGGSNPVITRASRSSHWTSMRIPWDKRTVWWHTYDDFLKTFQRFAQEFLLPLRRNPRWKAYHDSNLESNFWSTIESRLSCLSLVHHKSTSLSFSDSNLSLSSKANLHFLIPSSLIDLISYPFHLSSWVLLVRKTLYSRVLCEYSRRLDQNMNRDQLKPVSSAKS